MDETYHRARELQERNLAALALDSAARASHLKLAALHAGKADRAQLLAERYQPSEATLEARRVATG